MMEKTLSFSLYLKNICFVSLHFKHLLIMYNIGNILLFLNALLVYQNKFVVSCGKQMTFLEKIKNPILL